MMERKFFVLSFVFSVALCLAACGGEFQDFSQVGKCGVVSLSGTLTTPQGETVDLTDISVNGADPSELCKFFPIQLGYNWGMFVPFVGDTWAVIVHFGIPGGTDEGVHSLSGWPTSRNPGYTGNWYEQYVYTEFEPGAPVHIFVQTIDFESADEDFTERTLVGTNRLEISDFNLPTKCYKEGAISFSTNGPLSFSNGMKLEFEGTINVATRESESETNNNNGSCTGSPSCYVNPNGNQTDAYCSSACIYKWYCDNCDEAGACQQVRTDCQNVSALGGSCSYCN